MRVSVNTHYSICLGVAAVQTVFLKPVAFVWSAYAPTLLRFATTVLQRSALHVLGLSFGVRPWIESLTQEVASGKWFTPQPIVRVSASPRVRRPSVLGPSITTPSFPTPSSAQTDASMSANNEAAPTSDSAAVKPQPDTIDTLNASSSTVPEPTAVDPAVTQTTSTTEPAATTTTTTETVNDLTLDDGSVMSVVGTERLSALTVQLCRDIYTNFFNLPKRGHTLPVFRLSIHCAFALIGISYLTLTLWQLCRE